MEQAFHVLFHFTNFLERDVYKIAGSKPEGYEGILAKACVEILEALIEKECVTLQAEDLEMIQDLSKRWSHVLNIGGI